MRSRKSTPQRRADNPPRDLASAVSRCLTRWCLTGEGIALIYVLALPSLSVQSRMASAAAVAGVATLVTVRLKSIVEAWPDSAFPLIAAVLSAGALIAILSLAILVPWHFEVALAIPAVVGLYYSTLRTAIAFERDCTRRNAGRAPGPVEGRAFAAILGSCVGRRLRRLVEVFDRGAARHAWVGPAEALATPIIAVPVLLYFVSTVALRLVRLPSPQAATTVGVFVAASLVIVVGAPVLAVLASVWEVNGRSARRRG
jgi:hypothetical protein